MNQSRITNLLARRIVPAARSTPIVRNSLRTGFSRPSLTRPYLLLVKEAADHGAEIIVLGCYFVATCTLLAYHMIYVSVFKKNEINCLPSHIDLNEQFSKRLDWNDPRGQRSMGPTTRRAVLFYQNKLGWKDDLKDLLDEIYAFNKPGVLKPSTIAVPTAFDGMSKSLILQEDQMRSTELMRDALREALAEK